MTTGSLDMVAVIAGVAVLTGFLSGLLGIGGGIILAPLLLYVPPLFGCPPLSMHTVAGLTVVQGLVACIAGTLIHRRFHAVSGRLTLWMGGTIFIAALAGGAGAAWVANEMLLLIFAALALTATFLLFCPREAEEEYPDASTLAFSRPRAVGVAGLVGVLGGLVGQGGSFILIPLMTSFVRVPTRIAVGSNLAIVFLSTTAAFLGKAATKQIVWPLALPILVAVPPATWLGGLVSHRLPVARLRLILGICIGLAAAYICWSIVRAA